MFSSAPCMLLRLRPGLKELILCRFMQNCFEICLIGPISLTIQFCPCPFYFPHRLKSECLNLECVLWASRCSLFILCILSPSLYLLMIRARLSPPVSASCAATSRACTRLPRPPHQAALTWLRLTLTHSEFLKTAANIFSAFVSRDLDKIYVKITIMWPRSNTSTFVHYKQTHYCYFLNSCPE